MGESYTEGVAIRGGRELCVGACEGVGEASVAVRAGWAIEPRNGVGLGCRRRHDRRKATSAATLSRVVVGPCAVGEPVHVRKPQCARTGRSHGRPSRRTGRWVLWRLLNK